MKRRGFLLRSLAGLVTVGSSLPFLRPALRSGESLTAVSQPLAINQLRSTGVLGDAPLVGNEEAIEVWREGLVQATSRTGFGMSVRQILKADLAQQLENELDRRSLDALTGKNFKA